MKTLLIGADGLLGSYWLKKFRELYPRDEIKGTSRRSISSGNCLFLDLCHSPIVEFKSILLAFRPKVVVYLAGMTNVDDCEHNQQMALELNAQIPASMALQCHLNGTKFLYISTDHLFGDTGSFFKEDEPTSPVNYYAQTKKRAEELISSQHPQALIVRTNFFGKSIAAKPSFSDWIEKNLREGKRIQLSTDVYFNPVFMGDLLRSCYALLEKDQSGIFNVASDDRLSKYEFGLLYAEVFGLNPKLIIPHQQRKFPREVRRPSEMSLSNEKLNKSTGFQVGNIMAGFEKLKKEASETKRLIAYGRHSIDQSDIDAVVEVLKGEALTQGPHVDEFERSVRQLVGAKYAVAVMNWTSGIHIACKVAGLNSRNALLTSPLTFCASSNGALFCNSTPRFADIDPETLNIDPKKIDEAFRKYSDIKVIMPVHFGGLSCDMEEIQRIARKYDATIIEDAAHAIGGRYADGSMIGNCKFSEMVGFSFHPVKNIACGEGGIITTNNELIYRQLLRLRSHGINKLDDQLVGEEAFTSGVRNSWYHEMQILGYNYRMTDIQAALGNSQLRRLDMFLRRRVEIARRYEAEFKKCENLTVPQMGQRDNSGNHLFVLRVKFEKIGKSRNQVIEELRQQGVQGHVHYLPVPMMPYYRENHPAAKGDYLQALAYYREALTIPLFPAMTDSEVVRVISAVKKIIG